MIFLCVLPICCYWFGGTTNVWWLGPAVMLSWEMEKIGFLWGENSGRLIENGGVENRESFRVFLVAFFLCMGFERDGEVEEAESK